MRVACMLWGNSRSPWSYSLPVASASVLGGIKIGSGFSVDGDGVASVTGGSMVYPGAGIPVSTGSAWGTSIANNSANWNAAYSWGNHAGLYAPAAHVGATGAAHGNATALVAGFMTAADFTKLAGIATQADKYVRWYLRTSHGYTGIFANDYLDFVAGSGITIDDNITAGNRTITFSSTGSMVYPGAGIPLSTGSAWGTSITNNSANWNTAYGWGNHAGLYTPLSHKTIEDALNGLVKVNGAGGYSAVTDNSSNWNDAYSNMGKAIINGEFTAYCLSETYFMSEFSLIRPKFGTATYANLLPVTGGEVYSKLVTKQDALVSGTNIKTINGTSILGSGDLTISGATNYWTYSSGLLYPNSTSDKLLIGSTTDMGSYIFQVSGTSKTIGRSLIDYTGAATAYALYVTSNGTIAAGCFLNTSGEGVSGISSGGKNGGIFQSTYSSTNSSASVVRIDRLTSGTPATGIGSHISFYTNNSTSNTSVSEFGRFGIVSTAITAGSESGKFVWSLVSGGAIAEKMSLDKGGLLSVIGGVLSSGGAIGYTTGAGSTASQGTSKATAVTCNALCGDITTFSAALAAAGEATFTVNNNKVLAGDIIIVNHVSGGTNGAYLVSVTAVATGSFSITYSNVSAASKTEAPVFRFAIFRAVTS